MSLKAGLRRLLTERSLMALAFLPSSVQFLAGLQHGVKCRPSRLPRQGEEQVEIIILVSSDKPARMV